MSDDEVKVPGPATNSRGAQVVLTGEAQDAARGGLAGDLTSNTVAKKALEADGSVADGYGPDGTTLTDKPAAEVVVTEEGKTPGEVPAERGTTRVTTEDPDAAITAKPRASPAKKV